LGKTRANVCTSRIIHDLKKYCKICDKKYHKEYYQQNKEKLREYCQQNKERIDKWNKEYREQNKERIGRRCKEYR
jgi:hypothetical protein